MSRNCFGENNDTSSANIFGRANRKHVLYYHRFSNCLNWTLLLRHWAQDNMDVILQTTFSKAFCEWTCLNFDESSLMFVADGLIYNKPPLRRIMVYRRSQKLLSWIGNQKSGVVYSIAILVHKHLDYGGCFIYTSSHVFRISAYLVNLAILRIWWSECRN